MQPSKSGRQVPVLSPKPETPCFAEKGVLSLPPRWTSLAASQWEEQAFPMPGPCTQQRQGTGHTPHPQHTWPHRGAGFRILLGVRAPPACLRPAWTLMDAEAPWPQPSHTWTLYWPEHSLRIRTRPRVGAWDSGGTFPAGTNKERVLVDSKSHLQKAGSEMDKTQVKFNQEMQPHVPHEGCSPEPDSKWRR